MANYKTPDWFRDAKFGMWAHWTAQCVPEQGDWYARRMYIQGEKDYDYHVKNYGHPSKVRSCRVFSLNCVPAGGLKSAPGPAPKIFHGRVP